MRSLLSCLARYVDRIADLYFVNLDAIMIYRLDRFGRGGHHRPFNGAGFPAGATSRTLENVVVANYLFGVAAKGEGGHESPGAFPDALRE